MFESDWLKLLLSLKLKIRIVFTDTPPINSFCKIYRLKEFYVCQKANSQFVQTLFILRRKNREVFLTKLTYIVIFLHIFDISQSQHRIVRVSRGFNIKSFAINLIRFIDLKTQQRCMFQGGKTISKRKLTSLVNSLRDFLKASDHASKCIQMPLAKPKVEIGSTKSKNNLFAHYYNDIIEHPNRQIGLPYRFARNISCVFSIEKFELHGNQFILT